MPPLQPSTPRPPGWNERRAARLATVISSAAVVVADIVLLFVFLSVGDNLPGGWNAYWYIPAGIAGILLFAGLRFYRQLMLFRRGE
jgi:hypothetical protein